MVLCQERCCCRLWIGLLNRIPILMCREMFLSVPLILLLYIGSEPLLFENGFSNDIDLMNELLSQESESSDSFDVTAQFAYFY